MDHSYAIQPLEFERLRLYLLEHALTDMGRERIQAVTPMTDPAAMAAGLAETVEMKELLTFDDALPLHGLKDIRPMLRKLHVAGMALGAHELRPVYLTLTTVRQVRAYFKSREEKIPLLSAVAAMLGSYTEAERRIAATVEENGDIKDAASPALRRIRRDIAARSSDVRRKIESLARTYTDMGYATEPIVTIRQGRMVIPIKDEFKYTVRGFIHDESSSGQTVFIEPAEALEINNEVRKLYLEESREIERILLEISDLLRRHIDPIMRDVDHLGHLEFVYAKARFAIRLGAVRPRLNHTGDITLRNAFHPLLLLKEMARLPAERRTVVPLNLDIGRGHRIIIISGPNAGGKTVALKTVGLLVLMVQSGLLIPAGDESNVGTFDRVLADIGDDQSIENDLSTFSSHVRHLANMVRLADERSLILVDEIGSGTDPREGSSLAISIIEHFRARNAAAIVTTHHGELKAFAESVEGIENGSMEFDRHSLQPTYIYRHGIPGSSYALEISRRMGLDDHVLERAREISGREVQRTEELIQNLQAQVHAYEQRMSDLSREKARLDGLQKLYDERVQEATEKNRTLRRELIEAKKKILHEANSQIEQIIRELREKPHDRDVIHRARTAVRNDLAQSENELRAIDMESRTLLPVGHVHAGDRVFIPEMNLDGVVLEGPDERNQVSVGVGSLTLRLDVTRLARTLSPENRVKKPLVESRVDWDTENIGHECDLRGLTAEEAVTEVDKYIGEARALGLARVTIIHGKGSGILRRKVGDFLKRDSRIQQFRLGQWGEGDTGVTVVELKNE